MTGNSQCQHLDADSRRMAETGAHYILWTRKKEQCLKKIKQGKLIFFK